jgi:thiol-disulfide isomerase/thioredoxin
LVSVSKVKSIDVVYANWCPHCVPTTVEPMKKAAADLGVPLNLLDIDTPSVDRADYLVKEYGDWSPDYIIPQVFVEFDDGTVRHVLTGQSQGLFFTRQAIDNFLKSDFFKSLIVH